MERRAKQTGRLSRTATPRLRWSTLITACLSILMLVYLGAVCWFAVARSRSADTPETKTPPNAQQHKQQQHDVSLVDEAHTHAELATQQQRTLRFQVCNGFGNQRLAVMYAAILAKGTGRALVLPQLISEGTQRSFADNHGSDSNVVDFGAVYDVGTFKRQVMGRRAACVPLHSVWLMLSCRVLI